MVPAVLDFGQKAHFFCILLKLFSENVWWVGKKCVPLQSLFRDSSGNIAGESS